MLCYVIGWQRLCLSEIRCLHLFLQNTACWLRGQPDVVKLINSAVWDNKKAGVLDPAVSKIKSLKFATEAAITILRIDDMIKLAPEKREEGSYGDAVARGELYVSY